MTTAATFASSLVRREESRLRSRMEAYRAVSAKVGRSASWLRRLIAGGGSGIDAAVRDQLHALLVRELENEIARLTHELETARRSGVRLDSLAISEIETHLAKVRALLNGAAP